MWLMTEWGFFSAVEHRDDPGTIIVRARCLEHLEFLSECNPIAEFVIEETPEADYGYRARMPRSDWAEIVHWMADRIDYDNFKAQVARNPDIPNKAEYGRFLNDVWVHGVAMQGQVQKAKAAKNAAKRGRK